MWRDTSFLGKSASSYRSHLFFIFISFKKLSLWHTLTFHSSTFQSAFQEQQQNNTEKTERQANLLQRSHTVVLNVKIPPKHKFVQGDFTSFSMEVSANSHTFRFRFPALHIQNLSNRYRHKYDSSISQIFWISFLAGFCNFTQLCVYPLSFLF